MTKEKLKLLIIGTDPGLNERIRELLSEQFEEVYLSDDGEKGFQLFRRHMPDLTISELELPSLSGMDLMRKVKKLHTRARCILIQENKDVETLIAAIEYGIKGFLLKPVDMDKLKGIVDEEVVKILSHKKNISEGQRRLYAEEQYDKSKRILQVISTATASFFQPSFNDDAIYGVLKMVGEVTGSSRVYIYRNYKKGGEEYTTRINEWTSAGIMPTIGNLPVTDRKIATSGFGRWVDVMKKHKGYITGSIRDFELVEQQTLKEHGIKSVLAIPIFSNDEWWGFLGLDDCEKVRNWTDPEISALEALANNLGAAFHKRSMDQEMILLNESLEKRVKERTRELEFEVAERAMAEALLKDSEEKYRLIYENATDGILLIQRGRIMLVNPAIVEILEEIPRNLIGKKFSEIVSKENRKEVKRQFRRNREEMRQDLFHVKVEINRDKTKWLELKPTLVTWYGVPAQLVFVSNITKQKNAQDELYQLNVNLEKRIEEEIRQVELQQQLLVQKSKLESIGELSAGLAHEINQPLVSISMGLDNMLLKLNEGKEEPQYLKNKIRLLFNDIDRIKNIIEHVRTFSRDQQDTVIEEIMVSKVIMNALSLVQKQLDESDISLDLGCLGEDLLVLGNPYKLEQVILNMISNARYALVEKAGLPEFVNYNKIIGISCRRMNNTAVIEIRDNGIGIPEEVLPNIFDPFFTTKAEEKGTGLGLSISYGIIKEMKGNISAESVETEFTSIKVELPLIT